MSKKPMLIKSVDTDLKNRFRSICISKGKKMNETIIEFMKQYIKRNGGK